MNAKKKTTTAKQASPEEKDPSPEKELTEEEKLKKEEEEEREKEQQLRFESSRKAGAIHKQVMEFIKPQIKVGTKYLDICEKAEAKIIELGGEIGFPTNVCVNEVAAHYTSPPNDESEIKDGDIVKIDVGVSVEGYVADGAFSISFNDDPKNENLILSVETAVLKAIGMIKPGVKTNEIGRATSKIIRGFGFNPIRELSGHSIEKWQVHGFKEIPNVDVPSGEPLEEGDVIAIECFASTGAGQLRRGTNCEIYEYNLNSDRVPLRNKLTKRVVGWIAQNKKALPFSTREVIKEFRTGKFALRELITVGKISRHSVLREDKGTFVAQWEHTVLVTADGCEQLT